MSTKTPRVSVLTPIYNTNPTHLRECIESILNQTFTDFEFLILNDSPDNTEIEKIVLEYAKHDKRIKYSKNERNMGITPSRNKLLKMARGEYLAIFDHDDISVPTRLEQEVAFLDKNPHIGVVSGWLQYFGDSDFVCKTTEHDFDIKVLLSDRCALMHTAAMLRKSVLLDNAIQYDEEYTPNEDHWLWVSLIKHTHFYNIQQVLVNYRWYTNNTSHKQKKLMDAKAKYIRMSVAIMYPFLRTQYEKYYGMGTIFRLRLFGKIPLIKIKNNWVYLFEIIPVFNIRWK